MTAQEVKAYARSLGFSSVGIARAEPLDGRRLDEWLRRGFHADMEWMRSRRDLRLDPTALVPDARTVIVCALKYFTPFVPTDDPRTGRISRYAWGDDYHRVMRQKLKALLAFIKRALPEVNGRCFVDSAPLMEKVWAVRAGIGRQGKHSLVISREAGSWLFLGEVIVDLELQADEPQSGDPCGSCSACIDACPTRAIVAPGVVDARRCISYLTVERRQTAPLPKEVAALIGNRIFGCDACQEVCPWNRTVTPTSEAAFQPRPGFLNPMLEEWAGMSCAEFEKRFAGSPVRRAGWEGLKRNLRTALQNRRIP